MWGSRSLGKSEFSRLPRRQRQRPPVPRSVPHHDDTAMSSPPNRKKMETPLPCSRTQIITSPNCDANSPPDWHPPQMTNPRIDDPRTDGALWGASWDPKSSHPGPSDTGLETTCSTDTGHTSPPCSYPVYEIPKINYRTTSLTIPWPTALT